MRDYDRSKRFYARSLRPLGFGLVLDWHDNRRAFFGLAGQPSSLWLVESDVGGSLEVCLAAGSADAVVAFHAAAVDAGAEVAWEPGVRSEYSRDYYAARVYDPDGNCVEVVYRGRAAGAGERRAQAA